MLSGRGLCDELIARPEESYRLCCAVVCDLETSRIGAPYVYMTLVAQGLKFHSNQFWVTELLYADITADTGKANKPIFQSFITNVPKRAAILI